MGIPDDKIAVDWQPNGFIDRSGAADDHEQAEIHRHLLNGRP
jgi:hypothetical protein